VGKEEMICGKGGNDMLFLRNQRTPAATRKSNHNNNKQTTKQENQIKTTQTKNKTIKT